MPYKNHERKKEYIKTYMRERRAKANGFSNYEEYVEAKRFRLLLKKTGSNRTSFLELEIQRLQKCLETVLKNKREVNDDRYEVDSGGEFNVSLV